jgi:hypothetical protein
LNDLDGKPLELSLPVSLSAAGVAAHSTQTVPCALGSPPAIPDASRHRAGVLDAPLDPRPSEGLTLRLGKLSDDHVDVELAAPPDSDGGTVASLEVGYQTGYAPTNADGYPLEPTLKIVRVPLASPVVVPPAPGDGIRWGNPATVRVPLTRDGFAPDFADHPVGTVHVRFFSPSGAPLLDGLGQALRLALGVKVVGPSPTPSAEPTPE